MIKKSFFYNYTANKFGGYNRFSYGIMTAELDNDADDVAKKDHPDADINITAFNRV